LEACSLCSSIRFTEIEIKVLEQELAQVRSLLRQAKMASKEDGSKEDKAV